MAEPFDRAFPEQYMLRMPAGMRDALKARAKANGRSMNVEAVMALEAWLEHGRLAGPTLEPSDAAKLLREAMVHFTRRMADMIAEGHPLPEVHDFIEKTITLEKAEKE